jgi:hypothetical protein
MGNSKSETPSASGWLAAPGLDRSNSFECPTLVKFRKKKLQCKKPDGSCQARAVEVALDALHHVGSSGQEGQQREAARVFRLAGACTVAVCGVTHNDLSESCSHRGGCLWSSCFGIAQTASAPKQLSTLPLHCGCRFLLAQRSLHAARSYAPAAAPALNELCPRCARRPCTASMRRDGGSYPCTASARSCAACAVALQWLLLHGGNCSRTWPLQLRGSAFTLGQREPNAAHDLSQGRLWTLACSTMPLAKSPTSDLAAFSGLQEGSARALTSSPLSRLQEISSRRAFSRTESSRAQTQWSRSCWPLVRSCTPW